jgi:hypothetical protein
MQTFEAILDETCEALRQEARLETFKSSRDFERRVREVLDLTLKNSETPVDFQPHPHLFPDIVLGHRGIEVKFTEKDTWRSVANSVFESTKSKEVDEIYVIFGKMGGIPDVRWARYEDSVLHVRTSHVPRFELEIGAKESLFQKIGLSYAIFTKLNDHEKMRYIRNYARGRLKQGSGSGGSKIIRRVMRIAYRFKRDFTPRWNRMKNAS